MPKLHRIRTCCTMQAIALPVPGDKSRKLRVVHEYLRIATRSLSTADRLSARFVYIFGMMWWTGFELDGTFVAHTHLSDLMSIAVGCSG